MLRQPSYEKVCAECDQPMTVGRKWARFCGSTCRDRNHGRLRRKELLARPCKQCGKEFLPSARVAVYCSDDCRRAQARDRAKREVAKNTLRGKKWRHENRERFQQRVAKWILANRGRFKERQNAWVAKNRESVLTTKKNYRLRNKDKWHRYSHERRARRYKVIIIEKFEREEIFARDLWRCRICGSPVDRSGGPRSSLFPTIDHILPLAKGGQHTRDNVQTAHRVCNLRKHTKVDKKVKFDALSA